MDSRLCLQHKQTASLSAWWSLALGCSHLNCRYPPHAHSLCPRVLNISVHSHFVLREIHYYVVGWRERKIQSEISSLGWLLLMTRMKDGGILRVCEQRDSSLHHFMMDKFPPSSRHALVVTVMTSGFLLLFWRAVGCDSHTVRYQHVSHCSPSPLLILFHVLYYPPGSNDKLHTYCPFYQSHPKRSTTSETMNYISFSPLSLSCPVWCFRNNSSIENSTSSDKSYYNTMQHNNRGQPALNSRWVLPVPGRKWHWAPLLSYFILAENRDYHHFIFCKSIPHRVCYKFISFFLSSFSAWIPLGLLSSLARKTGCTKSSILPQNSSSPCCGVSLGGKDMIPLWLTAHRCAQMHDVCAHVQKNTLKCTVLNKGLLLSRQMLMLLTADLRAVNLLCFVLDVFTILWWILWRKIGPVCDNIEPTQ